MPTPYVEPDRPARIRYVRYLHVHVGAHHLAIADPRVFGKADGPPPPAPELVSATRLRLTALNKGVRYFVAVEAFDERGVSKLSRTLVLEP